MSKNNNFLTANISKTRYYCTTHYRTLALTSLYKPIYLTIFLGLLILVNSLSAQNISTISEIYNYDEGDIFHMRFYEEIDDYWWETISSRTITNKYYSPNYDTVFYTADVIKMERETYPPDWEWSQYTINFYYTNLDSLINDGIIDSVYTNEDLYNGREINYYEVDNPPNTFNNWRYVDGCGRSYYSYHGYGFGSSKTELIYYLKGDDEWGEPILILGLQQIEEELDISIYPNPVRDQLNIKADGNKFEKVTLFTTNGANVLSKDIRTNSYSLDVSGLLPGTYIISLTGKEHTFTEVFVKE